jgi:hypothetical protein
MTLDVVIATLLNDDSICCRQPNYAAGVRTPECPGWQIRANVIHDTVGFNRLTVRAVPDSRVLFAWADSDV